MRNCIHCKKGIDANNGYVKKLRQDGTEIETYICSDCKNQEENTRNKLKSGNFGRFFRLVTAYIILGILGTIIHTLITIVTKEYYLILSLGMVFLVLVVGIRITKCRLGIIQRVVLVIMSLLFYLVTIGVAEYVLYLNYEGIAYSDMLPALFMNFSYTLQFIFLIIPFYLITESYHILSILGIIIGVWMTTGNSEFSQSNIRYKKLAK